jgi:hypothetical protein
MDPITLIAMAVAAGAAPEVQGGASPAVQSANSRLRALVARRFAGRPTAELVMEEYDADPAVWEKPLAASLSAVGAGDDADLVDAAKALLSLVDRAGARAGKYAVTIQNSRGVQVGDHNSQTNSF